jgi:hypothetical protein
MLLFVEGCTCSGKSTFCQKFLNDTSNLCIMAPKHTPDIIANENPLARQIRVFKAYMENFQNLVNEEPDKFYLADYSPAGVIPFSLALAKTTTDLDLRKKIQLHAIMCTTQWNLFYTQNQQKIQFLQYCQCEPEEIIKRLKQRNRLGDSAWKESFIYALVKEYDDFFNQLTQKLF